jgi:hypothetical protein
MTRSRESGENETTDEAQREAARTGKNVCAILAAMLRKAKKARDKIRQKKIEKAQKYLGCRNVRKRGSKS